MIVLSLRKTDVGHLETVLRGNYRFCYNNSYVTKLNHSSFCSSIPRFLIFLGIFFTTRLSSQLSHLVLSTRKSLQWWNRLREPWPTAGHDLTRLDSWPDDQLVELNYWISCYDMCARAASHSIIAVARTHLRLSVPLHPLKRLAIHFSLWEFSGTNSLHFRQ